MSSGPPPPLPSRETRPSVEIPQQLEQSKFPKAGALYPPGQYPTPDLLPVPTGRYALCDEWPRNSETIQNALNSLGNFESLFLPQGSSWDIDRPIQLGEHQELATWAYPTDEKNMAVLEAGPDCYPHIINARAISGARLRSLVIEGNRDKYGHETKCGVMLQFGHRATDQVINGCIIRNPRHWSCIQAFEGCTNVRITNNIIGPAGIAADKAQGQWADGISYAGSYGLVAGNRIIDATDGAIVVFGAPGTLVISNTIESRERLGLGGINMVDWAPHTGHYKFTRVLYNTIKTVGNYGYFKTGIGQGPSVWWSNNPPDKVNKGGIIMYNLIDAEGNDGLRGTFGYGFAVAPDVDQWTCVGNASSHRVKYEGDISGSLPVPNAAPCSFIHDISERNVHFASMTQIPPHSTGAWNGVILQPEFKHSRGRISSLISIQPGPSRVLSYQAGQFQLQRGQAIYLKAIVLKYDSDNVIRIQERRGKGNRPGSVLWEEGPGRHSPGDTLVYSSGGKLCIVSQSHIIYDFTPFIPLDAIPEKKLGTVVLSDTNPYMSVTTSGLSPSLLFASSYIFPQNTGFAVGQIIARSQVYDKHPRTLLYTLSPYGQYVVLRSKHSSGMIPTLPLAWPSSQSHWDWEIIWHTPNQLTQERDDDAKMFFQGDGNLVIYSNNTVPWASGTHNKNAMHLRLGLGSLEEPWLELIDEQGSRIWSSTG